MRFARLARLARLAIALAATALVTTSAPRDARAGEVQVVAGAGGLGSTWHGDGAGFVSLQLGYRFADIVAPYFLGRAGYAVVDQRVLELIQIGVQVWGRLGRVRPYARFGLTHQHEEPWPAVQADAFGAIFGVGDGIRHRFGLEGGLGADVPIFKESRFELHARIEAVLCGFPDPRGPAIYGGGTLGLGFNYSL